MSWTVKISELTVTASPYVPTVVNPVNVVTSGRDASTFNVGTGPVKLVPLNPVPANIPVRSPPPSTAFTILLFESKPKWAPLAIVPVEISSK